MVMGFPGMTEVIADKWRREKITSCVRGMRSKSVAGGSADAAASAVRLVREPRDVDPAGWHRGTGPPPTPAVSPPTRRR